MDKKKPKTNEQPKNTSDIRSFFYRVPVTKFDQSSPDNKSINNQNGSVKKILLSSDEESPIKKNNFTQLKRSDKMPKRKVIIDSSSDEEVIHKSKKTKKSSPSSKKILTPKKEESKKEIKGKKRKKDETDDDEIYEPVKEKKSNKKSTTASKKPKKETKSKSSKSSTKEKKSKSIVRPVDEESDDEALECKMVKKSQMEVQPGFNLMNKIKSSKIDADKMKISEMWVDKYKPTNVKQVIGQHTNKSCANKLKHWLEHWYENKDYPVKFGTKNETGIGLRAALLSGCPGIGKTTTAQLIAKECGFEFVEFNASDTRNKKSMEEQIPTLLNNKTLDGYVHDPKNKTKMTEKHLLIMDEVDGMAGNADRGGVAELIKFIRKTEIPIICICNDRGNAKIRNLANYCFDLRFSKPRVEAIKSMVLDICNKENVKVSSDLLSEIIEMSNHDIRQVIHYVSVFATKNKSLSDVKSNKIIKDVTLGPFDAVKKVFTDSAEYHSMSMREKSNIFFNDYQLLPLFAWENYIQCKPTKAENATETLAMAAKSIDAICIGDMIDTQIKTTQNWSLLPFQSIFSCVMPGHYMNGHFQNMILFPSLLGKISSTNKKDRLVQELKQHMNLKITGSKTCLNLDYIVPLRDKIVQPLIKHGNDGISDAIETLTHYSLLKDDLDSIIELSLYGGEKSPYLKVDTKTKSALTRNYNKAINPFPYAVKDQIKKLGKGETGKKKDSAFASDEEDAKEEEINAPDEELLPEF